MQQVEIPNSYFYDMSKKDYSQFETALIREYFQNSVDAGATEFLIDFYVNESCLIITDNGCGMDKDTIINKLLVMGKSYKTNDNATGAFGHAKILLYFSWQSWEIRTQNLKVTGTSHFYTIEEVDDWVDGCISTILMDEDRNLVNFGYYAREFFHYCDTQCHVKYRESADSEYSTMPQRMITKDCIYDDENFKFFKTDENGWYIVIRQNGIYMFKQYIYSSTDRPMAIVEIQQKPELMFLQSRDHFKEGVKDSFDDLKRQLTVDHIDTFTIAHDKQVCNFNFIELDDDIPVDDDTSPVQKVITYMMDTPEIEKEVSRLRSKRLLNICYAYRSIIAKKISFPNVVFGFTTANHDGMHRYNRADDQHEIYINLKQVTKHSPNYRKMSVILLNIIKHELAHVYNVVKNGNTGHDEDFVSALDKLHDTCWDTTPFTTKFKEVWKNTSK